MLASTPASAQSGASLAKCEKAIGKEVTKYSGALQKTVAKCLDKVARAVLDADAPIAGAAKSCAAALRKIDNSENATKTLSARFQAKVAKHCDPDAAGSKAEHTQAEVLDPDDVDGLQSGLLDAYCGGFGGDGTLDTVSEWIACADEAAICTALQQVAVEYPRAPEWLGGIASAITALDPNAPKYLDAAGVASAFQARIDDDMDGAADLACGPAADGPPSSASGLPATGQTISYGTGTDGDVRAGVARSFTDNGDGTITDNVTGLMWEKKSDDGTIHDKDNAYTWSTGTNNMDGTIATTFLATLNAGDGFAGYTDWRLPNAMELFSLVNMATTSPAVHAAFNDDCTGGCSIQTCSCTTNSNHYTSTTDASTANADVWTVRFDKGIVSAVNKGNHNFARAVRGGL